MIHSGHTQQAKEQADALKQAAKTVAQVVPKIKSEVHGKGCGSYGSSHLALIARYKLPMPPEK